MTAALREPIQTVCIREIMVLRTLVNCREFVKHYLMYKTISDFTEDMYMSTWVHTCMCIWMAYSSACVHMYVRVYMCD